MPFYERGVVRIHYEEAGSGFPLLVIPGGGLNSTIGAGAWLARPTRSIHSTSSKTSFALSRLSLRNAKGSQSSGPLEVDRPWDSLY